MTELVGSTGEDLVGWEEMHVEKHKHKHGKDGDSDCNSTTTFLGNGWTRGNVWGRKFRRRRMRGEEAAVAAAGGGGGDGQKTDPSEDEKMYFRITVSTTRHHEGEDDDDNDNDGENYRHPPPPTPATYPTGHQVDEMNIDDDGDETYGLYHNPAGTGTAHAPGSTSREIINTHTHSHTASSIHNTNSRPPPTQKLVTIRWIYGSDPVLFESFCGMVRRKVLVLGGGGGD